VPRAGGGDGKGHVVVKLSADGKVLMTLGKPGGAAAPEYFYQPNDIVTAPNGDIFVAEGHGGANSRILKFTKDGKLIAVIGKKGTGPGEFDQPHALAFDSKGRLFVGDRSNNRIQILDQQGRYIDEWKQFSRPSGIYIDKNDVIYVSDSESGAVGNGRSRTEKRGIRVGGLSDGKVIALIPDPVEVATRWGVFSDILNAEPSTVTFMQNVLTEVMAIFPGRYIHVGGDEASRLPFCLELAGELADRGRLARPVDADHENDERFLRGVDLKFCQSHEGVRS